MKNGGATSIMVGRHKNAIKNHKPRITSKEDFMNYDEDKIDTRLTGEELKKPLYARGAMEKVASKLDKLKIKPIVQPPVKTRRKKKPIVLEL